MGDIGAMIANERAIRECLTDVHTDALVVRFECGVDGAESLGGVVRKGVSTSLSDVA